jgi:nucleoside-diphosphate-sugar epimerase
MDYLGPLSAPSCLKIINLFLDMDHNQAVIPGDGEVPFVLTHSTDVAKFVAAALDLEKWNEVSLMVGDRITINEIVAAAEEAKG